MESNMIKAGIIGATGYAGNELVRLLLGHKEVELKYLASRNYAGKPFSSLFGNFYGFIEVDCDYVNLDEMAGEVDVIFTATPQGYLSGLLTEEILEKARFIDLSADYRLKDVAVYEKWYDLKHPTPGLIERAVYGLPEMDRTGIAETRLLANPGCYTTCSILTAYPLIKEGLIEPNSLIVNALSGVSGAGRGAKVQNLFCEVNESAKAYGVTTHRHTPEIEEQLSKACGKEVVINFTPHLVPMHRGILVTETASLKPQVTEESIREVYENYYGNEYFIRLLPCGVCPETRYTEGSNYVDIGFKVDSRTNRVILMGALDNLIKGAAGQAVQNMNIMFGFPEWEGLQAIPMVP